MRTDNIERVYLTRCDPLTCHMEGRCFGWMRPHIDWEAMVVRNGTIHTTLTGTERDPLGRPYVPLTWKVPKPR